MSSAALGAPLERGQVALRWRSRTQITQIASKGGASANRRQSPPGHGPPPPPAPPRPGPHVPPPGPRPPAGAARRSRPPLNRHAVSTPLQRSRSSPGSARSCPRPAHAPAHWPPQAQRAKFSMPLAITAATHPATPPRLPARESSFLPQSGGYRHRAAPAGNSDPRGMVPSASGFQSCPGVPGAESRSDRGLAIVRKRFATGDCLSRSVLAADALPVGLRCRFIRSTSLPPMYQDLF